MASEKDNLESTEQEQFKNTQAKFQAEYKRFLTDEKAFTPYYDNMKKMDNWLKEAEADANS